MGSRSSNSTTQNITNIDRRLALNGGSVGVSGDKNTLTINALDGGAIKTAADTVAKSLNLTSSVVQALKDGNKNALDYGVKITDSAFEAIGESQHVTAEINRLAIGEVANAWNNAKAAADGKSMGDYKYLIYGGLALAGLLIWTSRGH